MIEKLNTMNSMELPQLTELISTLEQETKNQLIMFIYRQSILKMNF